MMVVFFEMKTKYVILALCLVINFSVQNLAAVAAAPNSISKHLEETSRRQKALQLLRKAKEAQSNGHVKESHLYFLLAKQLNPSLATPSWITEKPSNITQLAPEHIFIPAIDSKDLYNRAKMLSYQQAKRLLEDWLKRFPLDYEARRLYLELAQKAGDQAQIVRHQSVLEQHQQNKLNFEWHKAVILIILIILLIWQIKLAWLDWKNYMARKQQVTRGG